MKRLTLGAALVGAALTAAACTSADGLGPAPAPVTDAGGGSVAAGDAGVAADADVEPSAAPLPRVAPPFDVTSTAAMIDAWPRIVPGIQARAVTSFDRGGGNDDGFAGTYSSLGTDADGANVIFDELGPGVLRTLWFTSAIDGDSPLGLGKVRFWFDDEAAPRLEVDSDALFAGRTTPFLDALADANHESTGGFASWAPLPFRRRLRITTEKRTGFYAAYFDVLPPDWDIASWTHAIDAALPIAPATAALSEVPLDPTRSGAGIVDVLRFVPDADATDAALSAARIRIWFDGAAAPHVDVPLAVFFGSGRGVAPIESVAWTMRPRLFESRLPMPFWDGVRIAVDGIAGKLSLHVAAPRWPRAETGTLEVHLRPLSPTEPGKDVVYADVAGAGKLVATVLAIDPETPSTKRWWEGDLRVTVDGARTPIIHGTGHEDDHLGGWSNELLSRPFTRAMQGCPRTDLLDTGADFQKNGATTMYRLWPGIPFRNALTQSVEHGTENSVQTRYLAAAFLYRAPPRTSMSDAYDVEGGTDATSATSATSAFEGANATPMTHAVVDTRDATAFELAIDPENDGVFLRRLSDRHEAPARARLEVDGVHVATVQTLGPIADSRAWLERDHFVPPQVTKGKSRLHVRWAPESGASLSARFEAWPVRAQNDL